MNNQTIEALKQAAAILGEIPSPPTSMGTQEPSYRAYKILCDEIERIEAMGDREGVSANSASV